MWQDSSDPHEQCGSCFLSSLAPNEDKTRKMPQGRRLGHADQDKFGEYVESIRTIERQMDKLAGMKSELDKMKLAEPSAAYIPRGEHIRLMGDLMVAALQSGLTNVATLMIGPERWDTPYLFEEVSKDPLSHHKMSHNPVEYARQLEQVDEFHMRQFAYLVEKMDAIREADGSTLLDNTLFTYGSGLGDGSAHPYDRLPIIVAGQGGGRIKTGRHLQCAEGTPLAISGSPRPPLSVSRATLMPTAPE